MAPHTTTVSKSTIDVNVIKVTAVSWHRVKEIRSSEFDKNLSWGQVSGE